MKLLALIVLAAAASCEFTCIKPVNPIPAGDPGLCCKILTQDILLTLLYTGEDCNHAIKLSEAADGSQVYSPCKTEQHAACCDPINL
ncbi:hypothetical protein N7448_001949 [Penicillium atrosanguineum]|uniref:Hydrophobin n=1 Tax=Penicillium atrosanguineum TaxID=1132637 RepID=A0A9W9U2D0_9EURO|nr:hypothetical protein N7526_006397 [Penicillium atrosanguineum]KAJ5144557.1 hypothetical protein N7448_001949 [Penicillium atrosanguineum]KAJ5310987.1 hypothetical protein N7476_006847 [Penicillium atrosanguineum]